MRATSYLKPHDFRLPAADALSIYHVFDVPTMTEIQDRLPQQYFPDVASCILFEPFIHDSCSAKDTEPDYRGNPYGCQIHPGAGQVSQH